MRHSVIFDLYGTLLEIQNDSRPFLALAKRSTKSEIKNSLKKALTEPCSSLSDYCTKLGLPLQNDIELLESSLRDDIDGIELFHDSRSVLMRFKKSGVKTCLISNLASPYKLALSSHGLLEYFDSVICSCDVGLIKPNPEIYSLALKELGSLAEQTVMIGDSYRCDVDGPSKIGIQGHLLDRGNTDPKANCFNTLLEFSEWFFEDGS